MKILDARAGRVQTLPFTLGERGRARKLVNVDVDPRTPPEGPESVGYQLVSGAGVVLTRAQANQHGVLVHIDTKGCYTRGTQGHTKLKGGEATCIATGEYAYGDAGGIGGGTDELWHVTSPTALWIVVLSGGSYKGFGLHYCILTRTGRIVLLKRPELCQLIAVDDDPEVAEVVRLYAETLHEDICNALALADRLDGAYSEDVPVVHHYFRYSSDIESIASQFHLAVPVFMKPLTGGVSGIEANTLLPGEKSLVYSQVGPGGGRRYGWEVFPSHGLTLLREERNDKNTAADLLALVESPDWYYAWKAYKDGALTSCAILTAEGEHQYSPSREYFHTNLWEWKSAVLCPKADLFVRAFGEPSEELDERQEPEEPILEASSATKPMSLEGLQDLVNKKRLR